MNKYLRILFIGGMGANQWLAMTTFYKILRYGKASYAEPNNLILYSEIFSVIVLGILLLSFIKNELEEIEW